MQALSAMIVEADALLDFLADGDTATVKQGLEEIHATLRWVYAKMGGKHLRERE